MKVPFIWMVFGLLFIGQVIWYVLRLKRKGQRQIETVNHLDQQLKQQEDAIKPFTNRLGRSHQPDGKK